MIKINLDFPPGPLRSNDRGDSCKKKTEVVSSMEINPGLGEVVVQEKDKIRRRSTTNLYQATKAKPHPEQGEAEDQPRPGAESNPSPHFYAERTEPGTAPPVGSLDRHATASAQAGDAEERPRFPSVRRSRKTSPPNSRHRPGNNALLRTGDRKRKLKNRHFPSWTGSQGRPKPRGRVRGWRMQMPLRRRPSVPPGSRI